MGNSSAAESEAEQSYMLQVCIFAEGACACKFMKSNTPLSLCKASSRMMLSQHARTKHFQHSHVHMFTCFSHTHTGLRLPRRECHRLR